MAEASSGSGDNFMPVSRRAESRVIILLERVDRAITTVFSPIATSGLGIVCLYYVAVSYGFLVIGVIGGRRSLTRLITNTTMNPMLIVIGVPMIPVSLIMLEALDIEEKALNLWRNNVSPKISNLPVLGQIIGWVWPKPHRVPVISRSTGFVSTIDFITRSVTGGLVLPFVGYLIGRLAFKNCTRQSSVQKVILGGLIFYIIKTTVKVYLKQQQYRRQGFRRVLDYKPEDDKLLNE